MDTGFPQPRPTVFGIWKYHWCFLSFFFFYTLFTHPNIRTKVQPMDLTLPLHFIFFFPFIFISWRLITLQYCSGFCHTKIWNASRIFMSSLRRGHANLLCMVPILVYVLPKRARHCTLNVQVSYWPQSKHFLHCFFP